MKPVPISIFVISIIWCALPAPLYSQIGWGDSAEFSASLFDPFVGVLGQFDSAPFDVSLGGTHRGWGDSNEFQVGLGDGLVIFDDFNYSHSDDPELAEFGWQVVDGINGPPSGSLYKKTNIVFNPALDDPNNQIMTLYSRVLYDPGTGDYSFNNSRIQTAPEYLYGTYAARMRFTDGPVFYKDGSVQTFYTINDQGPGDPDYSECDFEYLPWDVWGDPNGQTILYLNTWETWHEAFDPADRKSTPHVANLSDYNWYTLHMHVRPDSVEYFVDDNPVALHSDPNYCPETNMRIAFAHWLTSYLAQGAATRHYWMDVDWMFHAADAFLSFGEFQDRVNLIRSQGYHRYNNWQTPLTPAPIDPSNHARIIIPQPDYLWTPFQNGGDGDTQTGYQFRVRCDDDADRIVYDTGLICDSSSHAHLYNPGAYSGLDPATGATRTSEPLQWCNNYHWHIRYLDSGGQWSIWSSDTPTTHQDFYFTIPGDFQPDCIVDLRDLFILSDAWLSVPVNINWNPYGDINSTPDNIINLLDLSTLILHWLKEIK